MRALVVSNMLPDGAHPERGRFVRDQVSALRELDGVDVELHEFAPGGRALMAAPRELHGRYGRGRPGGAFDVVHSHFGLTAWPAMAVPGGVHALTLHGTDLAHPRTRLITLAALPRIQLLATVSSGLAAGLPRWAAKRALVLPCGVDIQRFHPIDRPAARAELGLSPTGRYLLFAADPARPEKRHDRAVSIARDTDAQLLTLGGIAPERVPLLVNAANAVLVPSEREGFGLAVLEALACDVPVLATPVGVHPQALAGIAGTSVRRVRGELLADLSRAASQRLGPPRGGARARSSGSPRRRWPRRCWRPGRAHSAADGNRAGSVNRAWIRHPARLLQRHRRRGPLTALRQRPRPPSSRGSARAGGSAGGPAFSAEARELAYRDLGGLVFNLHRFGERNDSLVLAKLATLSHIDSELRTIEKALGDSRPITVLREAGITACPRCAAIHGSEDRFCPNCGLPLARNVDLPIAGAPASTASAQAAAPPAPAAPAPATAASAPAPVAPAPAPAPAGPPTAPLVVPASSAGNPSPPAEGRLPGPVNPDSPPTPGPANPSAPAGGARAPVPPARGGPPAGAEPPRRSGPEESTEILHPPASGA